MSAFVSAGVSRLRGGGEAVGTVVAYAHMAGTPWITSLFAAFALTACASTPARKQPAAVQQAPSDAFAMRKPDHISSANDPKLGELRSVPAAKSAREPGTQASPPDPLR
jgi:hypothetical protein